MLRKTSIRIFLFFVVLIFLGEVCVYGADDFGLTTRLALVAIQSNNTVETSGGGVSQAKHLDSQTPRLALFMDFGQNGSRYENIEDILTVNMSAQGFLQLVERAQLKLILKEHEIGLSALVDNNKAIQVGNLVGAEYLLFVKIYHNRVSIRLIEVRTGKIVLEEDLNIYEDIFLTSAAIREKVIKALKLKPNITECHTVGIISFINKSGTDRSDKLNLELQKSIRQRLRSETWATLLERQYPTGLLEEVELARMGLTKDNVEKLPPADMVIFGTLQDVSSSYKGNTWDVNIELLVRLQKRTASFTITCQSDRLEETAKRIVEEINNFRRKQTESFSVKQEKELWRRQALYLMPRSSYQVGRYYFDCISERQKNDTLEAIRAWENLLLLDPDNTEAKLNLGMCLISLYRSPLKWEQGSVQVTAREQTLRGSLLVEAAMRTEPSRHNAATFAFIYQINLEDRSKEICQYILANQELFKPWEISNARIQLARLQKERVLDEIDNVASDGFKDPASVCTFFIMLRNNYANSPDRAIRSAQKYVKSKNPLVRFMAEWTTAEFLYNEKKDPSALIHFDRAIEVHDGAVAVLPKNSGWLITIDDIYRYKICACQVFGQNNLVRETALRGAEYFMRVSRFNHAIDWLLYYCVMEVLDEKEAKQGLVICDAYLKAMNRNRLAQAYHYPAIIEAREKFKAIIAGTPIPNFAEMNLVKGTEKKGIPASNRSNARMAAAGGKIWLVWEQFVQHHGPAVVYVPGSESANELKHLPRMRTVAAVGERVFIGGRDGLYEIDTNGKIVKHYQKENDGIPSNHIVDLCVGENQLYMSFRESDRYGVAALDLISGSIKVLAPTSREATLQSEPVYDAYRLWWDAINRQLYVNSFVPMVRGSYAKHCWVFKQNKWERLAQKSEIPICIVSNDTETLRVQTDGKKLALEFIATSNEICWPFLLPGFVGEPAWDAARIWIPTYIGLYEVNRNTGKVKWLAHQDGTQCLAALRYMGRLYVATNRGLYWCDIL